MGIRKVLNFVEYASAGAPKTKFGGQPDWIQEPQWPLSTELQSPMRFIGQISLGDEFPEFQGKMAYIFMTEDDDKYVDGTWEPDGGENAVIIQPADEMSLAVKALVTGPSRQEYGIKITEAEEGVLEEGSWIGGTPEFMQGEEYPEPKENWIFLAQLDSCSLPFEVNFGDAGIAYVFVNKDASAGKFLWQCG
jgi:uncharacterized protein YwqG